MSGKINLARKRRIEGEVGLISDDTLWACVICDKPWISAEVERFKITSPPLAEKIKQRNVDEYRRRIISMKLSRPTE